MRPFLQKRQMIHYGGGMQQPQQQQQSHRRPLMNNNKALFTAGQQQQQQQQQHENDQQQKKQKQTNTEQKHQQQHHQKQETIYRYHHHHHHPQVIMSRREATCRTDVLFQLNIVEPQQHHHHPNDARYDDDDDNSERRNTTTVPNEDKQRKYSSTLNKRYDQGGVGKGHQVASGPSVADFRGSPSLSSSQSSSTITSTRLLQQYAVPLISSVVHRVLNRQGPEAEDEEENEGIIPSKPTTGELMIHSRTGRSNYNTHGHSHSHGHGHSCSYTRYIVHGGRDEVVAFDGFLWVRVSLITTSSSTTTSHTQTRTNTPSVSVSTASASASASATATTSGVAGETEAATAAGTGIKIDEAAAAADHDDVLYLVTSRLSGMPISFSRRRKSTRVIRTVATTTGKEEQVIKEETHEEVEDDEDEVEEERVGGVLGVSILSKTHHHHRPLHHQRRPFHPTDRGSVWPAAEQSSVKETTQQLQVVEYQHSDHIKEEEEERTDDDEFSSSSSSSTMTTSYRYPGQALIQYLLSHYICSGSSDTTTAGAWAAGTPEATTPTLTNGPARSDAGIVTATTGTAKRTVNTAGSVTVTRCPLLLLVVLQWVDDYDEDDHHYPDDDGNDNDTSSNNTTMAGCYKVDHDGGGFEESTAGKEEKEKEKENGWKGGKKKGEEDVTADEWSRRRRSLILHNLITTRLSRGIKFQEEGNADDEGERLLFPRRNGVDNMPPPRPRRREEYLDLRRQPLRKQPCPTARGGTGTITVTKVIGCNLRALCMHRRYRMGGVNLDSCGRRRPDADTNNHHVKTQKKKTCNVNASIDPNAEGGIKDTKTKKRNGGNKKRSRWVWENGEGRGGEGSGKGEGEASSCKSKSSFGSETRENHYYSATTAAKEGPQKKEEEELSKYDCLLLRCSHQSLVATNDTDIGGGDGVRQKQRQHRFRRQVVDSISDHLYSCASSVQQFSSSSRRGGHNHNTPRYRLLACEFIPSHIIDYCYV